MRGVALRIEAAQRVIVVAGLPVHHYSADDAVAEAYARPSEYGESQSGFVSPLDTGCGSRARHGGHHVGNRTRAARSFVRRFRKDAQWRLDLHARPVRESFVHDGGLISCGDDPSEIFQRSATYVDRILCGARPSDLPFQLPNKVVMAINLRTAKALVLTILPDLLVAAGEGNRTNPLFVALHMAATQISGAVRFRAAFRGIADIRRA